MHSDALLHPQNLLECAASPGSLCSALGLDLLFSLVLPHWNECKLRHTS